MDEPHMAIAPKRQVIKHKMAEYNFSGNTMISAGWYQLSEVHTASIFKVDNHNVIIHDLQDIIINFFNPQGLNLSQMVAEISRLLEYCSMSIAN